MGGMVAVLARFKDNTKMSFRISTGCLTPFHDLRLLDEDYFKAFVKKEEYYIEDAVADYEQEDYYNARCFFAPYDYGLLFFDFKEKHIWSSNNYNGFFSLSSWQVKSQYKEIADILSYGTQTKETLTITEQDYVNGEFITRREYHFLEDYSQEFSSIFYMQQVLDKKGTFTYKGNPLPDEITDIYSLLAYINGEDLLLEENLKRDRVKNRTRFLRSDTCDLDAVLPDWTIYNGDGNVSYIQPIFDYVVKHNILNERDLKYWNQYLND
jgi:hypothetical protein